MSPVKGRATVWRPGLEMGALASLPQTPVHRSRSGVCFRPVGRLATGTQNHNKPVAGYSTNARNCCDPAGARSADSARRTHGPRNELLHLDGLVPTTLRK